MCNSCDTSVPQLETHTGAAFHMMWMKTKLFFKCEEHSETSFAAVP